MIEATRQLVIDASTKMNNADTMLGKIPEHIDHAREKAGKVLALLKEYDLLKREIGRGLQGPLMDCLGTNLEILEEVKEDFRSLGVKPDHEHMGAGLQHVLDSENQTNDAFIKVGIVLNTVTNPQSRVGLIELTAKTSRQRLPEVADSVAAAHSSIALYQETARPCIEGGL